MSATTHSLHPRPQPVHGITEAAPAKTGHFLEALNAKATTLHLLRDATILKQDAPVRHCHLVVSGCIRTVRLLPDGRRQLAEFLLPGDLFGIESLGRHEFGAEAVTGATVRRYARRDVDALAAVDATFARHLHTAMAAQLRIGLERIVTLGRRTASERISGFLLDMAGRMSVAEQVEFELPMNRADMADYLGLTVETVSRAMTCLGRSGIIAVNRARITIRDRLALDEPECVLH
jgi:CRP-like cAMP-binding protein